MPLTDMQKASINATIEYDIEDLEECKDKSKALRAFQLMLKDLPLSTSEGAALSSWLIDEDELDKKKQEIC
jgi:hypothetical protein|tara:strand:+ start:251 stop:463 length:213 start_codon:yes stop_codon:yes gene_type:complete